MRTHLSFKINSKTIRYVYDGAMKASERGAVNKFIGMAYNMSAYAIKQLDARTPQSADFFKMIYGESTHEGANQITAVYKSIMQHIERNLKVRRENVFFDEDGKEVQTVLSGADLEKGVVIIYDAFFKKAEGDDKGLNARSSVIMHEIAHLVGLEGDEEQGHIDSAECLRNLTLLVCEIVKPADLFIGDEEANEENAKLVGEDGELPNNPNHYPAGAPDGKGGQFAPKEGGSAGGGNNSKDERSGNAKSQGIKLAPGVNAKVGPDGNSIVIGGKITGPNESDKIEIGNDGAIRVNPNTGIGIQIHGNQDITVESDKPIDVLSNGKKVGSFRKIRIDKNGNINEKESQIKGRIPFTGALIVDGLQNALNKNKSKK